eukprot:scaffold9785_cov72-Attheya_sp.AAC.1
MKVALLANYMQQQQQQQYHSSPSRLAAAAFVVEEQVAVTDVSRMASMVATGVGFLGAGVISNHDTYDPECTSIRGLQTAAAIWVSAIIGVLSACGLYLWSFLVSAATIAILRYGRLLDPNIPSNTNGKPTNMPNNNPSPTTTTATAISTRNDDQINRSIPVTPKLSDPSQPLPTSTSPSLVVIHKQDGTNTTVSSPKGVSSDKKIWYKQQDQQQRRQQASLEEEPFFVEDFLDDVVSNPIKKDARTSTRVTTGRLLDSKEEEDGSQEDTSLFRDSADSIRSAAKVMDPLLSKFLQRGGNLSDTFSGTATVSSSGLMSTNRTLVEPSET